MRANSQSYPVSISNYVGRWVFFSAFLVLLLEFITDKHYEDVDNRKNIFLDYAKQKGFNPLIPEHWYSITNNSLRSVQVCAAITITH